MSLRVQTATEIVPIDLNTSTFFPPSCTKKRSAPRGMSKNQGVSRENLLMSSQQSEPGCKILQKLLPIRMVAKLIGVNVTSWSGTRLNSSARIGCQSHTSTPLRRFVDVRTYINIYVSPVAHMTPYQPRGHVKVEIRGATTCERVRFFMGAECVCVLTSYACLRLRLPFLLLRPIGAHKSNQD